MSFLSVRAVILISNSLYAHSQRLRSISLELLEVYGMISALSQAAVPRRSPSLMSSKLHRLFLCGCTHCPGAETQIGGLAFFFFLFGGGDSGSFLRISWVKNESGQRQKVWTLLLPFQVAGDFDMWYMNRILQRDSLSTCGTHPLGRTVGWSICSRFQLCSVECHMSCARPLVK